jgi:hypothetical protein
MRSIVDLGEEHYDERLTLAPCIMRLSRPADMCPAAYGARSQNADSSFGPDRAMVLAAPILITWCENEQNRAVGSTRLTLRELDF